MSCALVEMLPAVSTNPTTEFLLLDIDAPLNADGLWPEVWQAGDSVNDALHRYRESIGNHDRFVVPMREDNGGIVSRPVSLT